MIMNESNRGRLTFGLVLLLTGVLLFLQLDPYSRAGFGMLWPLYPVLLGFMGLFNRSGKGFSLILLLVGLFFLLRNLNVLPYIPAMYIWPSVLILVAVFAIITAMGPRRHAAPSGGEGRYSATFGETKQTVRDQDFKGLSASALFGGVELDLSEAGMEGDNASIDVFVLFGGAEIIVPESWYAEVKITPIFGGVENKTAAQIREKKVLVTGTVLFGGAVIRTR
jgi:predicted membrane protein